MRVLSQDPHLRCADTNALARWHLNMSLGMLVGLLGPRYEEELSLDATSLSDRF